MVWGIGVALQLRVECNVGDSEMLIYELVSFAQRHAFRVHTDASARKGMHAGAWCMYMLHDVYIPCVLHIVHGVDCVRRLRRTICEQLLDCNQLLPRVRCTHE